jgi:hypothetical protein
VVVCETGGNEGCAADMAEIVVYVLDQAGDRPRTSSTVVAIGLATAANHLDATG